MTCKWCTPTDVKILLVDFSFNIDWMNNFLLHVHVSTCTHENVICINLVCLKYYTIVPIRQMMKGSLKGSLTKNQCGYIQVHTYYVIREVLKTGKHWQCTYMYSLAGLTSLIHIVLSTMVSPLTHSMMFLSPWMHGCQPLRICHQEICVKCAWN